jgi:DtxR family transcriptional regulator, Mn-dependent transcriptional regulator
MMEHQKQPVRAGQADADGVRITPSMEDYLKAIFRIEHDGETVSNQRLADELGLSGASISNMVKKLHDLKLIVHTPYKPITLTDAGNAVALEVIRHHRLLELFLASALGMEIDQVHDEADRLEHHVSEELERRIEQALGYPEFDPHGHPIPSRSGDLPTIADVPLSSLGIGDGGVVSRVSDRSPEDLRDIHGWKIMPGTRLQLTGTTADSILASIESADSVAIPRATAEGIHILLPVRRATS